MNETLDLILEHLKQNYVTSSQINKLNEDGNSVFTAFLEYYYNDLDSLNKQDKEQFLQFDIEDRLDLKDVIFYFLNTSADFDLFMDVNEKSKPALAVAVENNDYFMVKFLLTNNANPNVYTKKITIGGSVFYTNKLLEYYVKSYLSYYHYVKLFVYLEKK